MIQPLSQRRLCKSQRTVDFQGGVSSDFFWSLVVQRGTPIYSLILNLHVLQHLRVCVPWFPRLQKGQHLLINAKLPTSKSVSTVQQRKGDFLTISCMIVNEEGRFPLPWQWSSTLSPSLILPFGDSTQMLTAVEGSGTEGRTQHLSPKQLLNGEQLVRIRASNSW